MLGRLCSLAVGVFLDPAWAPAGEPGLGTRQGRIGAVYAAAAAALASWASGHPACRLLVSIQRDVDLVPVTQEALGKWRLHCC